MDPKIIAAALLWARNHIEAGDPKIKDAVIERLDRVLEHCHPTAADMQRFRDLHPAPTWLLQS